MPPFIRPSCLPLSRWISGWMATLIYSEGRIRAQLPSGSVPATWQLQERVTGNRGACLNFSVRTGLEELTSCQGRQVLVRKTHKFSTLPLRKRWSLHQVVAGFKWNTKLSIISPVVVFNQDVVSAQDLNYRSILPFHWHCCTDNILHCAQTPAEKQMIFPSLLTQV